MKSCVCALALASALGVLFPMPALAEPASLTYVALPPEAAPPYGGTPLSDPQGVKPAQKAPGIVHPQAVMAILAARPMPMPARAGQSAARPAPPDVKVAIALDAEQADAPKLNLIRIDLTGKGDFTKALTAATIERPVGNNRADIRYLQFGALAVKVQVGGKEVPAILRGSYWQQQGRTNLSAALQVAAEGEVAFGKSLRKVRVFDGNGNMVCGDAIGKTGYGGDLVQLADAEGKFSAADRSLPLSQIGQPMLVEGQWFTLAGADGKLQAKPVEGGLGKVHVTAPKWTLTLTGPVGTISVAGGADPVSVPAGTYMSARYQIAASADAAANGPLLYGYLAKGLTVEADKTAEVKAGPPLQGSVQAQRKGQDVVFNMTLTDSSGGRVSLVTPGAAQRVKPKIDVVDGAGKTVYSASLEFG